MAEFYQNIGHIILMLILLVCSAFFSGTETALFNITKKQTNQFKFSKNRLHRLLFALLNKPRHLLGCLLFGNMTVNVLFFAVSSILTLKIQEASGYVAAIVPPLAFSGMVLFGEIMPKSIAYANSRAISVMVALPVYIIVRIIGPVQSVFRFLLVEPIIRLLLGPVEHPKLITLNEFRLLTEQIKNRGLITPDENKLLSEIIELGFLKTRHVMHPRVDMIACNINDSTDKARLLMIKNNITKICIYEKNIDNIIGLVYLRDIFLNPEKHLNKLIKPTNYVPEQKTVESLLEFFRSSHTDMAVVVDEYGGIAGSVYLEDIIKELLGPIEPHKKVKPIEQIGPLKYRIAGSLAIHDWADALGVNVAETKFTTIGGLITATLGKIPVPGDVAFLNSLKFTVENVHKNRISTLIISFEGVPNNG